VNGADGRRLLDAVAVMDRLRSPGGCPWDAEQTHASLLRYLIEECYELVDAVENGDERAIREELGDVLLQVLFHARIAAERSAEAGGFDIDDVASDLVEKLIRRHPHVFEADAVPVWTAADQQQRWDQLKKAEHGRSGVLAGVALGQPSMALAAKLGSRAARFGLDLDPPSGDSVAEQLFRIAYAAGARGEDPESALRAVAITHANALAAAEEAAGQQS
jgi:XTP/dITP diphosphohydrolase